MSKLTEEQRTKLRNRIVKFQTEVLKPLIKKYQDEEDDMWLKTLKSKYPNMTKEQRLNYLTGVGDEGRE